MMQVYAGNDEFFMCFCGSNSLLKLPRMKKGYQQFSGKEMFGTHQPIPIMLMIDIISIQSLEKRKGWVSRYADEFAHDVEEQKVTL